MLKPNSLGDSNRVARCAEKGKRGQEIQAFFELFHGAVEGRSEEVDVQRPGMPRVVHAKPDAILAGLIALDTAAVFVA